MKAGHSALHDEERELRFWFDQLPDLEEELAGRGSYLLQVLLVRERLLMHALALCDQSAWCSKDPG